MSNNIQDDLKTTFKKRGIKTKSTSQEVLNFVGRNSNTTFSTMAARMAARFTPSSTEVAALGEAYDSLYYRKTVGSQEKTYEAVYGGADFTVPVEANAQNRALLDEIFGNNDNDSSGSSGGISEETAKDIIGLSGTTRANMKSLMEKHAGMYDSQRSTLNVLDEDSAGVRGVEDRNVGIDSIA